MFNSLMAVGKKQFLSLDVIVFRLLYLLSDDNWVQ